MNKKMTFAITYNGKLTFWGVYQIYKEDFHEKWKAESTQAKAHAYITRICKMLYNHNHRSIDMYSRNVFDKLIKKLKQRGKQRIDDKRNPYDEETIKEYEFYIRRVIQIAASHGDCLDLYDERVLEEIKNSSQKQSKRKKKIVKSLSIVQMVMAHKMLSNYKQSGKRMCLWLMYTKGLRNGESVAADFEDIKVMDTDPDCYELWVYKSAVQNSSKRKGSGKSKNADRILPLTKYEFQFLMKRKNYIMLKLKEMGVEDVSVVEKYPIGCSDNDFSVPLSSNDISAEGRSFFDELKIERELLMTLKKDLQEAVKHNSEEIDPIEDDITSYTFRRAYATRLHIMGFTRDQISYLLGHEIIDSLFSRNDFRYNALRMEMKKRMELMPLSGSYHLGSSTQITQDSRADFDHTGKYVVSANVSMIHVHVDAMEPNDTIKVTIDSSSKAIKTNVKAITSYRKAPLVYAEDYDLLLKFHHRVATVERQLKKLKEKQMKEKSQEFSDYKDIEVEKSR